MSVVIRMRHTGGPSVLVPEEEVVGVPDRGQVKLRQEAIGVNFIDTMFRSGAFSANLPFATGVEASESETMPEPLEGTRGAKIASVGGRRRRDLVWREIQSTPNFWSTLKPIDQDAVRRIHEMMLRHQWEVFFITQRPKTDGETVQRQTQRWLVEQGFDLPSVLVLGGSRGAAAGALRLDYHVDDSAQNCLDVIADSAARPILIVPDNDEVSVLSARKLGIGTARSIAECLDILEEITKVHTQPGLLQRLAALVGWR